jgi:hypothetical protein
VGYRPNGVIKMFHAVSFDPGLEMAKVLAFSAAALRAGVERVEKAQLELTAVIEPAARLGATDEEPERLELYRFGVETMEEHQIRVLTTSDMERVAETARAGAASVMRQVTGFRGQVSASSFQRFTLSHVCFFTCSLLHSRRPAVHCDESRAGERRGGGKQGNEERVAGVDLLCFVGRTRLLLPRKNT